MLKKTSIPRLVIAALRGGAGKTLLSVGLVAALRRRGFAVSAFKKGPDYIDAGWLGMAAGGDCYNLDSFLCDQETVKTSFARRSEGNDIAIVEGNRGLFDGVDAAGQYSTAELAKLLNAPVILIVDATKMTRTAAALVLGCRMLDSGLDLRGVILNRVAGARHERVLREAIETATCIPVMGSVSKLPLENFPQRHLGLLPLHEHPRAGEFLDEAAAIISGSVDLDRLVEAARTAGDLYTVAPSKTLASQQTNIRIGVLKDSAFQFYYPENLEALKSRGAELICVSALANSALPELDALYIGGGFPETHAERLAENSVFKESLLKAAHDGLPIYAECGGLMFLSRNLRIDENVYPMVGVFPLETVLERRPQGHGYIEAEITGPNPFYPQGVVIKGHEFHYSYVTGLDEPGASYAFRVLRGHGMNGSRDGICVGNALGTYVHVHALGEPLWAEGILKSALNHRDARGE
jgi:cobyrinic acid a,c-diamide synthase